VDGTIGVIIMAIKTPELDFRENVGKNYIINGNMSISQRNLTFTSIADSTYMMDRFQYLKSGAMVHTVTRDTDVPTFAEAGYLFQNSLRLNLTTPDTAIAATDYNWITQKIEGYNFANLAQKPFTLSFWVKATLPGIYCVSFGNIAGDQNIPYEYTINAANTWEYKTVTVAASPAAGTWNYTSGIGLYVRFILAAGANFQFPAGTWGSGNRWATANQINGVNTGATDFRLTGVMVNEGSQALSFRLFGGDFQGEVDACQRYYEKTYDLDTVPGTVTFTGAVSANHPGGVSVEGNYYWRVTKRAVGGVTFYSPQTGATGVFRDTTNGVDRTTTALRVGMNNTAWTTSGVPAGSPDVSGQIIVDVEL
jgi:hypothetical protein